MRTKSISDFSFSVLLTMASLLLATTTIILYSDNLEYKKVNRELLIQNDSMKSFNIELNSAINRQMRKEDNKRQELKEVSDL